MKWYKRRSVEEFLDHSINDTGGKKGYVKHESQKIYVKRLMTSLIGALFSLPGYSLSNNNNNIN